MGSDCFGRQISIRTDLLRPAAFLDRLERGKDSKRPQRNRESRRITARSVRGPRKTLRYRCCPRNLSQSVLYVPSGTRRMLYRPDLPTKWIQFDDLLIEHS